MAKSKASRRINTSFLERQNATDRHHNGRKVRKTYTFSKDWTVHEAMTYFTMYSYNFRFVRDAFEHIDERIESIARGSDPIVDNNLTVGNAAGPISPGVNPLRNIDIGTEETLAQDQRGRQVSFDYAAAVEEARRIAKEAVKRINEMLTVNIPSIDRPLIDFADLSD